MKIGFIYYTFYPVSGGASVHGFNLARELHKFGYDLYKINGAPDPYTTKLKNPVTGIFWILANCDLIYLRMDYFLNLRNLVSLFSLFSRKKLVVELNSPSDELHLFGRGKTYIQIADRVMSAILKRADAIITVSNPLKEYCSEALDIENVAVIENGGEVFSKSNTDCSESVKNKLNDIRKNYAKIVVWSGSLNQMQDLSHVRKITDSVNNTAVLLIVKEETNSKEVLETSGNLFIFRKLPRSDVKYIIINSDIGLALYSNYQWSRWGFYNSSLKMFEYLNNGLLTITNTKGTAIQRSYPNFRSVNHVDGMIEAIENYRNVKYSIDNPRTWRVVAEETSEIIQSVVNQ